MLELRVQSVGWSDALEKLFLRGIQWQKAQGLGQRVRSDIIEQRFEEDSRAREVGGTVKPVGVEVTHGAVVVH